MTTMNQQPRDKAPSGELGLSPLAPEVPFTPVSPDLRTIRLLRYGVADLVILIALAFVWTRLLGAASLPTIVLWILGIATAVLLIAAGSLTWVRARAVAVTGYYLGETELLLARGRMFRRLDIIPYGRMQEVHVSSGPMLRHFGLANVDLETASVTTDGVIPGIPESEAHRLREVLRTAGVEQMEGL